METLWLVPYRDTYGTIGIAPITKWEPNQALSQISEEKAIALFRAMLEIDNSIEDDLNNLIGADGMRSGLFNYMIQNCACRQTIILENEIPNLKYDGVNLIHFTKKENDGIYGLIKEYRE